MRKTRDFCLRRLLFPGLCLILLSGSLLAATDKDKSDKKDQNGASVQAKGHGQTLDEDTMRFEGEKRYSANCGRCHQAPHKLPPRAMATAIRHMRVRATLTEEDMRYLLWYLAR